MTPKEKADELRNTFKGRFTAIFVVNEIIATLDHFGYSGIMYDDFETGQLTTTDEKLPEDYWNKVKSELLKQEP